MTHQRRMVNEKGIWTFYAKLRLILENWKTSLHWYDELLGCASYSGYLIIWP